MKRKHRLPGESKRSSRKNNYKGGELVFAGVSELVYVYVVVCDNDDTCYVDSVFRNEASANNYCEERNGNNPNVFPMFYVDKKVVRE